MASAVHCHGVPGQPIWIHEINRESGRTGARGEYPIKSDFVRELITWNTDYLPAGVHRTFFRAFFALAAGTASASGE